MSGEQIEQQLNFAAKCQLDLDQNKINVREIVAKKSNYIFYRDTNQETYDEERSIDDFLRTIRSSSFDCPLDFWKMNENKFPQLASLAKNIWASQQVPQQLRGCSASAVTFLV